MKRFLLFIFLFYYGDKIVACQCNYGDNFFNNSKQAYVVILARVDSFTSYLRNDYRTPVTMKVTIIEKLKGNYFNKTTTIYGQDGINCLEMLNNFKVGGVYFFALSAHFKDREMEPDLNSFNLSMCGSTWTPFNRRKLTGIFVTDMKSYGLQLDSIQREIDKSYKNNNNENAERLLLERQKLHTTLFQTMSYKLFRKRLLATIKQ